MQDKDNKGIFEKKFFGGNINSIKSNRKCNNKLSKQVHWKTITKFFRNMAFGSDHQMRKHSFLVILSCGLAGILIDLDHLIIEETQMVRPLHLPIWITICTVCLCYYAYIHRRIHKPSLNGGYKK